MIEPWAFVVVVLATYRGARALTVDTITDAPRTWLALKLGRWSELVECGHCAGFWLAAISLAVWVHAGSLGGSGWRWVIAAWAAAGGQSLLTSLARRFDDEATR